MSEIFDMFIKTAGKYIDKSAVRTVYDIGAGDCVESMCFREAFPECQVFSFEANPACIYDCEKNIANLDRITLMPICVNNYTGFVKFHPINQQKTVTPHADGNPKASSIFVSNGTYPHETYIQDEIRIPCMTIEKMREVFSIPHPDIIWMDLQGAEVNAMKGFGDLSKTTLIHTEAWGKETYTGQGLYKEMIDEMDSRDFVCSGNENLMEGWVWADFDFIRRDLLENKF